MVPAFCDRFYAHCIFLASVIVRRSYSSEAIHPKQFIRCDTATQVKWSKDVNNQQHRYCTEKINGISACLQPSAQRGHYDLFLLSKDKILTQTSFETIGPFVPYLMIQQADLDNNHKAETIIAVFQTASNGIAISYWELYVLDDLHAQLSKPIAAESYDAFGGIFQEKGNESCLILSPYWELTTNSN